MPGGLDEAPGAPVTDRMTDRDDEAPRRGREGDTREARLKAALKANLARRKAQARDRAAGGQEED